MRFFLACGLLVLVASVSADQAAVKGLIHRILPKHENQFVLEDLYDLSVQSKDTFEIDSKDGKVVLRGNNGVSLASALNWYLKYTCHCQLSWGGDQLNLPSKLPLPKKERHTSPYKFRYNFNYCTFNYSMSWWGWKRWEREIDFMALNGINMPLALTGQEAVWRNVYKKMGFSDAELAKFFCGPAYFAWFWMGNLDAWGGPLPASWFDSHLELQKQILQREREFGMTPVLPAFTGHVPATFAAHYPQAKSKNINWGIGFADTVVLDPTDPMFAQIGEAFLKEQERLFGTDHYYSADTFNENRPPTTDPVYLGQVSKGIYDTMAKVDPQAVWVMQGWIFVNDPEYWKDPQIEALLTAVPKGKMVVLDLYSDVSPQWQRTKSYHGQPWVWCMLHNFGGRMNLFGSLETIAKAPIDALNNPASGSMQGIGFAPEAIENNPVIYELMGEHAWRSEPVKVEDWIAEYAWRRYGKRDARTEKAWKLLASKIYNERSGGDNAETSIVAARPGGGGWVGTNRNYDPRDLVQIWKLMVEAAPTFRDVDTFQYDLVDITRQVFADLANARMEEIAPITDLNELQKAHEGFLELIQDWDKVMATRKEFMLGRWIADARRHGKDEAEKNLMEQNARDLVTLWGDKNSGLHEYSTRQWAGLLGRFYAERWAQFFGDFEASLRAKKDFDAKGFNEKIKTWEWSWVNSHDSYPTQPQGNPVDVVLKAYAKYLPEVSTIFPEPPPLGLEQGAKATASSVQGDHEARYAIDGSVERGSAWWATPAPQWLQIELPSPKKIGVIQLWPYWDGTRAYRYTVEVSIDGSNWKQVIDQSKNTTPATARGSRFEIAPVEVKFVRVNMLGNTANEAVHLVEIRLYEG